MEEWDWILNVSPQNYNFSFNLLSFLCTLITLVILLQIDLQGLVAEEMEEDACQGPLTFCQRDGNDDSVACPHPQTVAGNEQGRDPHKRETQLPGP